MSLTQAGGWMPKAYLEFKPGAQRHVEGSVLLSWRTEAQERRLRFALFETTRLYAFRPALTPRDDVVFIDYLVLRGTMSSSLTTCL